MFMHNLNVKLFPFTGDDVVLFPSLHAYSQDRTNSFCSTKADFRLIQVLLCEFSLNSKHNAQYDFQTTAVREGAG
jgi:hypothetical protein